MKKMLAMSLFVLTMIVSMSANAIVITSGSYIDNDVGGIDLLLAQAPKAGNPTAETTWVNSILSTGDLIFEVKNETVPYYATNVDGVYAFALDTPPGDYFLIKNSNYMALFENYVNYDWGVFDTGLLGSGINLPTDDWEISHVSEFSSDTPNQTVPEPTSLLLFGLGLIGLAGYKRSQK